MLSLASSGIQDGRIDMDKTSVRCKEILSIMGQEHCGRLTGYYFLSIPHVGRCPTYNSEIFFLDINLKAKIFKKMNRLSKFLK